ncbi:MAG: 5-(carboxyamino)imidazole ribonucleotide synthase [Acidobacteriota bacterium]
MLPGATIGVLGGGQLGRMMALAARRMGYKLVALDPSSSCPTAQVADGVVCGALDDVEAATRLAESCDVVTLDTEHVPHELLAKLAEITPVRPGASVLANINDRQRQKEFLDRIGVPQARWRPVTDDAHLAAAAREFGGTAVLKARRAGYDGKGQARLRSPDDAAAARAEIRGAEAIVEELVPFAREISVILARGLAGDLAIYPVAENVHRRGILHTTRAPAPISAAQRQRAEQIAVRVAESLGHVGVIAVEMFELADGRLLVNEIAPRTHNSGHYTYGACATTQFEQHVRAICGLPLGDPRALTGAVMVNLMGDLWRDGPPAWQRVLSRPDAHLHLYGKAEASPGRKMGHVLLLDDDTDRALANAEQLVQSLGST